jgi:hypothetical protein
MTSAYVATYPLGRPMSEDKQGTGDLDPSELGRQLNARRAVVKGICPICKESFTGPSYKVYDKPGCAVTAARRRRKAAGREKREGAGRPPGT